MILLLPISIAYSQKRVLTTDGDTLVAFTPKQARWLLNQTYKVKELIAIDSVNKSIIVLKDSVITELKANESDYLMVLKNKDVVTSIYESENKHLKKVIRRQKIVSKVSLIGAAFLSLIVFIK